MEGAGTVEAIGPGVAELAVGDRVAYATRPLGAYAAARCMPADRLVKLPKGIEEDVAAASMLKGMTAQYLLRTVYPVGPGTRILMHAAAGGVGSILCPWAKHLGATVIGTVGTEEKAKLALANGCDHAIVYTKEDFVARVAQITGGAGVNVAYDSVGKDTFLRSIDCLAPMGMIALFGQSSGAVAPLDVTLLARKSLFLTRPGLPDYTAKREDLSRSAWELFEVIAEGIVNVKIERRIPLAEAASAHRDLEARKTTGSTILVP
jgi:NADPH2:quinone reductase